MNISRISALMLRQYYLMRDNPTRLIQIFAWILLELVLWGYISRYISELTETDFTVVFLGAILLWEFMVRVMQGLTLAFFEDVWSRNFLNIFASPISIGEYSLALIATSILTSLLGLLGMVLLAGLVFGLNFAMYGLLFVPFLLVLFLTGIALGLLAVAIVLRFGPSAEWFIWPIPAILAPFAGVFYPIETLPGWMQFASHALPPAYIFEGMRGIIEGKPFDMVLLAISTALALVYIALAYAYVHAVYRRAVRTGLLARYSAESV